MLVLELDGEAVQLLKRSIVVGFLPRLASRRLTGSRSASGRCSITLRSLCLTQRWTGTSSPNTCRIALRNALTL